MVFIKGINQFPVLTVLQHFLKNNISRNTLKVFVKGKNHLPVLFVPQHFLKKYNSRFTLEWFMKERNNLPVLFVLQHFLQNNLSRFTLKVCSLEWNHFLKSFAHSGTDSTSCPQSNGIGYFQKFCVTKICSPKIVGRQSWLFSAVVSSSFWRLQ